MCKTFLITNRGRDVAQSLRDFPDRQRDNSSAKRRSLKHATSIEISTRHPPRGFMREVFMRPACTYVCLSLIAFTTKRVGVWWPKNVMVHFSQPRQTRYPSKGGGKQSRCDYSTTAVRLVTDRQTDRHRNQPWKSIDNRAATRRRTDRRNKENASKKTKH